MARRWLGLWRPVERSCAYAPPRPPALFPSGRAPFLSNPQPRTPWLQIPFEDMFGKNKTPANWGPFTPNAEMRNGRAAMVRLGGAWWCGAGGLALH